MKSILVWDIPTRLLHWLLAGLYLAIFGITQVADRESSLFSVHMQLGLVVTFVVVLRIFWGIFGTRYARFSSFLYGPRALMRYVRGAMNRTPPLYVGHNPGSSYVAYGTFLMIPALAVTGVMIQTAGELHETLANAMIVVLIAHLGGVIWHTIRHRENVTLQLIHGRKSGDPSAAITSSRPWAGVLFLALSAWGAASLFTSYDAQTSDVRLPLIGSTLHIEREDRGRRPDYYRPGPTRQRPPREIVTPRQQEYR